MASYQSDSRMDIIKQYTHYTDDPQSCLDIIQVAQYVEVIRMSYFEVFDNLEDKGLVKQELKQVCNKIQGVLDSILNPLYTYYKTIDNAVTFSELAIELYYAFELEESLETRIRLVEVMVDELIKDLEKFKHLYKHLGIHKVPGLKPSFNRLFSKTPHGDLPKYEDIKQRVVDTVLDLQAKDKWLFKYFETKRGVL